VIPTIETQSQARNRQAATAASKLSTTVSGASCHVKSSPVGLELRASDLARQI
jgi:membrane fusion protein (multidrug efflux system)